MRSVVSCVTEADQLVLWMTRGAKIACLQPPLSVKLACACLRVRECRSFRGQRTTLKVMVLHKYIQVRCDVNIDFLAYRPFLTLLVVCEAT